MKYIVTLKIYRDTSASPYIYWTDPNFVAEKRKPHESDRNDCDLDFYGSARVETA